MACMRCDQCVCVSVCVQRSSSSTYHHSLFFSSHLRTVLLYRWRVINVSTGFDQPTDTGTKRNANGGIITITVTAASVCWSPLHHLGHPSFSMQLS
jgi:hypothetical protein